MSSTTRGRPIARGAVTGIAVFLAGYLVTYVWQAPRVRESLSGVNVILQFFGGEQIPAWKAVGWLFFNAHFVRTQFPGFGGVQSQNFIASGDFPALLYAVPIVLLLGTGFLLAWTDRPTEFQQGAMDGALLAIGYAGAAIVSVFVFGATRGDASIGPDPVTGVLLAGVVYPLVLAAIGGGLAGVVTSAAGGNRKPTVD